MSDALKKTVSGILSRALAGYTDDYKYTAGDGRVYIRWGLVEFDILAAIDEAMNDKPEHLPRTTTEEHQQ